MPDAATAREALMRANRILWLAVRLRWQLGQTAPDRASVASLLGEFARESDRLKRAAARYLSAPDATSRTPSPPTRS